MWETRGYKEENYNTISPDRSILKVFLSSPAPKQDMNQRKFNDDIKEILHQICKNKGIKLEIEGPYTLPIGGSRHNFWEAIIDFEKDCDFIIHDVTDCRRGVMVEIGFSFGIRKQHFVIWNLKKSPVKDWKEMNIPTLLPVTHIEQIDLNDSSETRNVLKRKIIEKAITKDRTFDCSACDPLPKKRKSKVAFVYAAEPELKNYMDKVLHERKIHKIAEQESKKELRVCQICQVLQLADFCILQLSEDDPDSYIVLGIAKAMMKKIFPVTFDKYDVSEFPWAKDIVRFHLGNIEQQLSHSLATFFNY